MTIAYIRTYSNKQQTESQKNAIEQFAKAKFKRFQALHSGKYTELTFKKEKEKRYRINIKSGIFRYT